MLLENNSQIVNYFLYFYNSESQRSQKQIFNQYFDAQNLFFL